MEAGREGEVRMRQLQGDLKHHQIDLKHHSNDLTLEHDFKNVLRSMNTSVASK